jgi:hypothetical protein
MITKINLTRHKWLEIFEQSPEEEFGKLVTGHADIGAINQLSYEEAAYSIFGDLTSDDPALLSLDLAVMSWLKNRRLQTPPDDTPNRQRWIREVRDAFNIVALLRLNKTVAMLKKDFIIWYNWVKPLVMTPSRDANHAFQKAIWQSYFY